MKQSKRFLLRCGALGAVLGAAIGSSPALETFGWYRNAWRPSGLWQLGYGELWWPHQSFPGGLDELINSPLNAPNLGGNLMEPIAAGRVASGGTLLLNSDGRLWGCGRDDISSAEFGLSRPVSYGALQQELYGDGTVFRLRYGGNTGQVVSSIIGISDAAKASQGVSAALRADGKVLVWGSRNGQAIGAGASAPSPIVIAKTTHANPVTDLANIKQVAVGAGCTLLLDGSGKVWSFGATTAHYLGRPNNGDNLDPKPVDFTLGGTITPPLIKQIDGGSAFAMALDTNGFAWAWGENAQGQLGRGTTISGFPAKVQIPTGTPLTGVKQVACTQTAGYALRSDGTVWAWGWDKAGQLGSAPYPPSNLVSPYAASIPGLSNIMSIWTQQWGLYALGSNGVVYGVGKNSTWELASTGANQFATPVALFGNWAPNPTVVKWQPNNDSVVAGTGGVLIRSTGIANQVGWFPGAASFSQLGPFTTQSWVMALFPQIAAPTTPTSRFRKYVTGDVDYSFDPLPNPRIGPNDTQFTLNSSAYTVAIDGHGDLWTAGWEHDPDQALGDGPQIAEFGPSSLNPGPRQFGNITTGLGQSGKFVDVDTFAGKTMAVTAEGEVLSFGQNPWPTNMLPGLSLVPQVVSSNGLGNERIIKVRVGWDHAIALTDAGHVYGIGSNDSGSNGLSSGSAATWNPITRPGGVLLDGVIDIATANLTCLALRGDGTLVGWGSNVNGALGATTPMTFTTNQHRAKPLTDGLLKGVKQIAMSGLSWERDYWANPPVNTRTTGFALLTNGRIASWGSNKRGQSGQDIPVTTAQVGVAYVKCGNTPLDNIREVGAGGHAGYALSATGNAYAWGTNQWGQSGQGTNSPGAFLSAQQLTLNQPASRLYALGVGGSSIHAIFIAANH